MTGWFKSTYTSGANPNCVEVRFSGDVGVRDSKDPAGTAFAFGSASWRAFVSAVKAGRFEH
ncbi:protein of unknown function [Lentzea fradiae]|uniref:DUF397 domain-containing protein n=1 Tax=Lentzea fradiae TaxID=200378 RepID=A0A1G7TPP2_9PSEU|nr:DUF397 domain-containing protein [Lentzea fradiae]SDG36954.1 protein of unknown function [Lentzea fradiae]